MRILKVSIVLAAVFIAIPNLADAQTRRTTTKRSTNTTATQKTSNLPGGQINDGLRESLFQGVRIAVDELGRSNGFLDNARVRIPLPSSLQKTEKALRALGQGRKVDQFVESMNHAAEEAVPVAADVFLDAIKQMSFTDAKNILTSGQEDAATQFFRRTTEIRLRDKFRPIVERFTEQVGVTQNYKQMVGKYGFLGQVVGQDASDIDGYVTQKALDGLFLLVADEEKKIRRDPLGQTSKILRVVFGSILK